VRRTPGGICWRLHDGNTPVIQLATPSPACFRDVSDSHRSLPHHGTDRRRTRSGWIYARPYSSGRHTFCVVRLEARTVFLAASASRQDPEPVIGRSRHNNPEPGLSGWGSDRPDHGRGDCEPPGMGPHPQGPRDRRPGAQLVGIPGGSRSGNRESALAVDPVTLMCSISHPETSSLEPEGSAIQGRFEPVSSRTGSGRGRREVGQFDGKGRRTTRGPSRAERLRPIIITEKL
jgi:hypothetical protein